MIKHESRQRIPVSLERTILEIEPLGQRTHTIFVRYEASSYTHCKHYIQLILTLITMVTPDICILAHEIL